MPLTDLQIHGLDLLLNESVLLDAQPDPERGLLGLTFYVETVPAEGKRDQSELYLQVILGRVSRIAASFRHGSGWDDAEDRVNQLALEDLSEAVRSIGDHDAVFGWRFFNVAEDEGFATWRDKLSLDFRTASQNPAPHTLTVWNEDLMAGRSDVERSFFDLRVWFEDLSIADRWGRPIAIDEAIEASRRYWRRWCATGSGGPSPYPVPYVHIPLPAAIPDS